MLGSGSTGTTLHFDACAGTGNALSGNLELGPVDYKFANLTVVDIGMVRALQAWQQV